ncbi:MAG: RnfABCDGE type electron transport complex subunit C [Erysipelotrichaceae bacterium]|nr:RnfABCDGE type electron transport complex subunit C [Erysipelotrichaceae bacterium]
MSLFGSKGHRHLDGHKELTKHEEIISLVSGDNMVKQVYFPTMSPNGKPITYTVKEGDYVKVGSKIGTRTDFYVPIYCSVSGVVQASKMVFSPQVGRAIQHVVIANDGQYVEEEPLKTVTLSSSKEEIFEAIKEAGLVGMGGAGFPTYIKYNNPKNIDTLLVNGVECEPYLTTDFIAMQQDVDNLLLGCEYLMKASGAKRAIIAFKVHKDEVKEAIEAKLSAHENITICEVPDQYPMGWERTLVKQVLKKEYDKLPSEAGAVVNNAQTVISLGKVLSTGKVITNRLVTVSGDGVNHPTNVLCPIGTLASELVSSCGGYVEGDINLIPGGPMCAKAVKQDDFPILLQMGSLTILKFKQVETVPCLRCGACTMNCPAGLQPVEIKIAFERKDTDRMEKLNIMSCVECGMCSYVCPSHIEVTESVKKAKMIYRLMKK